MSRHPDNVEKRMSKQIPLIIIPFFHTLIKCNFKYCGLNIFLENFALSEIPVIHNIWSVFAVAEMWVLWMRKTFLHKKGLHRKVLYCESPQGRL